MSAPKKTIHDALTGETITRDYTRDELAQLQIDKAHEIKLAADDAKAEDARDRKRQEVLDRLGITAEELKTILN